MTLNRIYVVELFYVDALVGGWLGPKAWEDPVPCPSVAEPKCAQAAMLSETVIKPPQLDEFFSVAEAPLRAIEFGRLGWSEETVWGR